MGFAHAFAFKTVKNLSKSTGKARADVRRVRLAEGQPPR
jgi:hypothetical protein